MRRGKKKKCERKKQKNKESDRTHLWVDSLIKRSSDMKECPFGVECNTAPSLQRRKRERENEKTNEKQRSERRRGGKKHVDDSEEHKNHARKHKNAIPHIHAHATNACTANVWEKKRREKQKRKKGERTK